MTVVPVAYDIPEEILAGLISGSLTRFGSVVRNRTGIIAHLKEVDFPESNNAPDSAQMAAALRNPKVLIGIGTVLLLAAAGGVAIWAAKKKSASRLDFPQSVTEYNTALAAYLEAIKTGSLDSELLDHLISALEAVRADVEEGDIMIEFSVDQSEALVKIVAGYTRALADANAIELSDSNSKPPSAVGNPIVDLRHWLEVQKRTFEETA